MIPEAGQLWLDHYNGLFLLTDIIQYSNSVQLYKLYSFHSGSIYNLPNPFGNSVPSNFTVLS